MVLWKNRLDQIRKDLQELADRNWTDAAIIAGMTTFYNTSNFIATKLASDLTTSLYDCVGGRPCWDDKDLGQYLEETGQAAVGDLLGELSENTGLSKLGFDLCNPNLDIMFSIQLGLLNSVKPKPRCEWSSITANWSNFRDSVTSGEIFEKVNLQFTPGQTPLSVASNLFHENTNNALQETLRAANQRLMNAAAGHGFTDVTDPVSLRIKSPGAVAAKTYEKSVDEYSSGQERQANALSGQIASRAWKSIAINAGNTVLATLLSKLMQDMMKGLMPANRLVGLNPDLIFNPMAQVLQQGAAAIPDFFFSVPKPKEVQAYDLLSIYMTCDKESEHRTSSSCVIDAQFAQAITQSQTDPLTVRQAVEQGKINGNWVFIPSSEPERDQDKNCYANAFCESNLKKLRIARIIPVGWEMVAAMSSSAEPIRLRDAMEKFNDCDPVTRGWTPTYKFCHMINPDWVLKSPVFQCLAQTPGPELLAQGGAGRAESCTDQWSCLRQDEEGNCLDNRYGYCTQEKNVWRFGGDICPAYYNTCLALTSDKGQKNLLTNTLDYGICNADNAGCKSYATAMNMGGSATDTSDDWQLSPARFFNKKVEQCDASAAGCTTLFPLSATQSLNLVRNGSFDDLEDGDGDGNTDHARFWTPFGRVPVGYSGEVVSGQGKAESGSALRLTVYGGSGATANPTSKNCTLASACNSDSGCTCTENNFTCKVNQGASSCFYTNLVLQDRIPVVAKATYTFAATFLKDGSATDVLFAGARLFFTDARGNYIQSFGGSYGATVPPILGECVYSREAARYPLGNRTLFPDHLLTVAGGVARFGADTNMRERPTCTFVAPDAAVYAVIQMEGNAFVDNIQLEEGTGTAFHEGYGAAVQKTFAKVPPVYLGCSGETTDRPECADYAGVCRDNEVGCQAYTPTNGDPMVPAVVGPQDRCPAECVGYDTFKQAGTQFDDESFPNYFIPATARACSEQEVGCSEFTNLENEAVEYYSDLRMCQKPALDDSAVFYSWEGSETTGFQLKVWNLKRTGATVSAVASSSAAATAGTASDVGATTAATNTIAPCTDIRVDGSNATAPVITCIDQPRNNVGLCGRSDIDKGNFDCREFYDADGNRHYRLLPLTILATDDCRPYRITRSEAQFCPNSRGWWDGAKGECIYYAASSESRSCGAEANNCRAYKGNAASNIRNVFNDDFETGLKEWAGGALSSESVNVGGHSLRVATSTAAKKKLADKDLQMIGTDRSYTLSFWARGNGQLRVRFEDQNGIIIAGVPAISVVDDDLATPTVTLQSSWRQYTLGPVIFKSAAWPPTGVATVQLAIAKATGTNDAYLDNIILKEVQDSIYVVRESWQTPAACEMTFEGAPSPHEMLGCREYTDKLNQKMTLRSFSNLCREKSVGCSVFSASQDTPANPYEETHQAVCRLDTACASQPSCVCNYKVPNAVFSMSSGQIIGPARLDLYPDVCRVKPGEQECRFTLEAGGDHFLPVPPDRVVTPADQRRYLVVNESNLCEETQASCRAVGLPHIIYDKLCLLVQGSSDATRPVACGSSAGCLCTDRQTGFTCTVNLGQSQCTVTVDQGFVDKWDTVTLKDDPTKYDSTLCTEPAIQCDAFTSSTGPLYFKDPEERICQYREGVSYTAPGTTDARQYDGWFRKSATGVDLPCYPAYTRNGTLLDIYKNGDGTCTLPVPPDSCTGAGCRQACSNPNGCACLDQVTGQGCLVAKDDISCGYAGWVGECQAQFDRCEEFVDPSDTSDLNPIGKPYYYLVNDKLDTRSCNGNAGVKEGCVLFDRTLETRKLYSSAATYATNADKEKKGAKPVPISPVNCNGQTPGPFCQNRCATIKDGVCDEYSENAGFSCHKDKDCVLADNSPVGHAVCKGRVTYGQACIDDAGCDTNSGWTCGWYDYVAIDPNEPRDTTYTPVKVQVKNDANTIIKVRPDRDCGQWLTCDTETVASDQNGQAKSICSSFGTCEGFNSRGECVNWVDPKPVVLTPEYYARRDTTWFGRDYSGYSISNAFPVQYVTSVRYVRPREPSTVGTCQNAALQGRGSQGSPCNVDTDCTSGSSDPRSPAFCDKAHPAVVMGAKLPPLPISQRCATDNDCVRRERVEVISGGGSGDAGGVGSGFTYRNVRTSTCIAGQCLANFVGGNPVVVPEPTNAPTCRAYPETDSPFPAAVRSETAFHGANTCGTDVAPGEICECSYTKIEYGQKGQNAVGTPRYFATGAARAPVGMCVNGDKDGAACTPNPEVCKLPINQNSPKGICESNDNDGCTCVSDKREIDGSELKCQVSAGQTSCIPESCGRDQGSVCVPKAKVTNFLGQRGLCLEYDLSVTINADPKQHPCMLWYPAQQLAGEQDLNNQHRDAGFVPTDSQNAPLDRDLLYCQVAQGNQKSNLGSGNTYEVPITKVDTSINEGINFEDNNEIFGHQQRRPVPNPSSSLPEALKVSKDIIAGFRIDFKKNSTDDKPRSMYIMPSSENLVLDGSWANQFWWQGENTDMPLDVQFPGLQDCKSPDESHPCKAEVSDPPRGWGGGPYQVVLPDSEGHVDQPDEDSPPSSYLCLDLFRNNWDGGDFCHEMGSGWEAKSGQSYNFNCFAAIAKFDSQEKFTGIVTATCKENSQDQFFKTDGRVERVVMLLKEQCTDVTQTYDIANYNVNDIAAAAQTDVIYSLKKGGPALTPNINYISRFNTRLGRKSFDASPLGIAIPPLGTAVSLPESYKIDDELFGGSPYTTVVSDGAAHIVDSGDTFIGNPHACIGPCRVNSRGSGSPAQALVDGETSLKRLFAYAWDTYGITSDMTSYTKKPDAITLGLDNRAELSRNDALGSENKAPRVRPVDTVNPRPCESDGKCFEVQGPGISVNGNPVKSVKAFGGATKSTIQFYAYADKNHMPIRRVTIDYGDNSRNPVYVEGYFKNHRGVDANGASYCNESQGLGGSPQGCENTLFKESHIYKCDVGDLVNLPTCPSEPTSVSPCKRGDFCVYRPAVQVMDNWAICNGICPGDGDPLCMNKTLSIKAGEDATPGVEECGTLHVNATTALPNDPWTRFAGEILVSPRDK